MSEKPPIYKDEGMVADQNLAHDAALMENESHKKTLGIFPPSRKKLMAGERRGEMKIEGGTPLEKKAWFRGGKVDMKKLPPAIMAEMKNMKGLMESVEEGSVADIGGGVMRYRFQIEEYSPAGSVFTYHHVVMDLKDGVVIHTSKEDSSSREHL